MWIILLDASGSMADPFEGTAAFSGRQRGTQARIKFEAAREALVLHLQGLGEPTQTAIFAFTSEAQLIYEGSSGNLNRITTVLAGVTPANGTDVAVALKAASDHIRARAGEPVVRVLLISDGLSDSTPAEAASKALLARRVPVDVILIDPTEKGNELARRVAGSYGSVTAVTSEAEMSEAVGRAGETVRAEAAAVEQARASLQRATAEFLADASSEEVSFTAAYPSELGKDTWASLLFFIHLSRLLDEARNRAVGLGRAKGTNAVSQSVHASTRLPRRTEITLTPHLAGFDINPASAIVRWQEDIQEFEFRIRPTNALDGPLIGEIEVSVRGLPIGRVPLSILIRPAKVFPAPAREPTVKTGGIFQTIFASHARSDAPIVHACAAVYAALGIYVIIDKQALISGQNWRPAIRALLAKSDTFQLFWSEAASVSPPVNDEIEDALTIQGDRGTGFIRPVYWVEPCPPLPSSLKHLNFAYLDLERIRDVRPESAVANPAQGRERPLKGAPNIPVAVLPLLPDIATTVTQQIAADVAYAIAFVEAAVGSRYYAVPTLLVDRHTVREVRAGETIDYISLEFEQQQALADWGEVLTSICLAFHVRSFWEGMDFNAPYETARRLNLEKPAFNTLRVLCEASPRAWFIPDWLRETSDTIPGLNHAATFQGAVEAITTAAMGAVVDPQSVLRAPVSRAEDPWGPWSEGLEKLGLEKPGAELIGTAASFQRGLSYMMSYLQPILADASGRFSKPSEFDERFRSALFIADSICRALIGDLDFPSLSHLVLHEMAPRWVEDRQKLVEVKLPGVNSNQTFSEFASVFFRTVTDVLKQRVREASDLSIQNRYYIPASAWKRLSQGGLPSNLQGTIAGWKKNEIEMIGPISAFIEALEVAWTCAANILRRSIGKGADRFLAVDVPTYGIFAPANANSVDAQLTAKAHEWGLPIALFLPRTDRVLVCGDALDDFQAVLNKTGQGANTARLFLRSILAHEHFHAYVQTAPLEDGTPAPGPGLANHWREASPVNEAIAAWMQVHLARDELDLSKRVWDYIRSGNYPQWPYAGATVIEQAYREKGLDEVRVLISLLRTDPPVAVAWMKDRVGPVNASAESDSGKATPSRRRR